MAMKSKTTKNKLVEVKPKSNLQKSMETMKQVPKAKSTVKLKATSTIKAAAKPKPAPSPTAVSQLKNVRGTLMSIPKDEQGNSLKYTAKDKNIYTGTYKGKEYTWKNGKFTK